MPERDPGGPGPSPLPEISLVIPVYNEEPNLPPLAGEIRQTMQALGRPYEVLLVDDGSTDGSLATMIRLASQDPSLRVIRQARNAGQSAALDAGFRHARGAIVVTLDADLQNDPADIPLLLARLEGGGSGATGEGGKGAEPCDVVCGVRMGRRDSWVRRLSSGIANAVRNRLTQESVTDVGCTLRACRAEYLRRIPAWKGMHRFLPTLLRMEGARIAEVGVSHRPRRFGKPKYNIRNRIWRASADLLGVRWLQSRWIDRRLAEEVEVCNQTAIGSPSDCSDSSSSPVASLSSGSRR
ncbi:MAG TPA: glycosyltransferase family 2 protein, partial [Thermoanaerobaculia bacterium]|nr:glycosyltransferase family 2 protein [Thermoanaerobaculia bacterium]